MKSCNLPKRGTNARSETAGKGSPWAYAAGAGNTYNLAALDAFEDTMISPPKIRNDLGLIHRRPAFRAVRTLSGVAQPLRRQ